MDSSLVRALNDWFSSTGFRADLARFLSVVPLLVIIALVAIAWVFDWGRAPDRRAVLIAGVAGAALALAVNVALGHLYYRPRPFVALRLHPLLPLPADSSLYSDQLAIAGALNGALLVTRRRLGLAATALAFLIALGRIAAGVHYPSDVLLGFLVGATCFAAFLPLRHPIARLVAVMSTAEANISARERKEENFLFRHGPLVASAILVITASLAYGIRALQDHGRVEAGVRAEARLAVTPASRPPAEFTGTTLPTIASGGYRATHATVAGDVTQVTRELDGDIHVRLEGQGTFVVLEIIPELPMEPPHVGQQITAWGIVRHDGLHNWWELHPLIGWSPGTAAVPAEPGPGTGD